MKEGWAKNVTADAPPCQRSVVMLLLTNEIKSQRGNLLTARRRLRAVTDMLRETESFCGSRCKMKRGRLGDAL